MEPFEFNAIIAVFFGTTLFICNVFVNRFVNSTSSSVIHSFNFDGFH